MYLMGWTGGYVLLAMLLAPYLRKYGKYTVPMFVGERYYSNGARVTAVICAIFVSFTYVAGQMRGVGIVFSRFMEVEINTGVLIGMAIVFFYAVTGGMKGITYTQVAQYWVLIVAYLIPAITISIMLDRHAHPPARLRQLPERSGPEAAGGRPGLPAGKAGYHPEGPGFSGLHGQGGQEHDRRLHDHLRPHGRHRRAAPHHHPLLHHPDHQGRPGLGRLGACSSSPCSTPPPRPWPPSPAST